MQYCEGKYLNEYSGKMTEVEILKIYKQMRLGLLYLHKKNIIQNEFSTKSIIVDEKLNLKIKDYGGLKNENKKGYYSKYNSP